LIWQPVALEAFLDVEDFLQLEKQPTTTRQESTILINRFFIIKT